MSISSASEILLALLQKSRFAATGLSMARDLQRAAIVSMPTPNTTIGVGVSLGESFRGRAQTLRELKKSRGECRRTLKDSSARKAAELSAAKSAQGQRDHILRNLGANT